MFCSVFWSTGMVAVVLIVESVLEVSQIATLEFATFNIDENCSVFAETRMA